MSGQGAFPLLSSWILSHNLLRKPALREPVNAQPIIWADWFFPAGAVPPGPTSSGNMLLMFL